MNLMSRFCTHHHPVQSTSVFTLVLMHLILFHCRELEGKASGGGNSSDKDKWNFTLKEKDLIQVPDKVQNGEAQPVEFKRKQVRPNLML